MAQLPPSTYNPIFNPHPQLSRLVGTWLLIKLYHNRLIIRAPPRSLILRDPRYLISETAVNN